MNTLTRFLSQLKRKNVAPKVYALCLESGGHELLYQCAAYSLEEAREKAVEVFVETFSISKEEQRNKNYSLRMWTVDEIEDFFDSVSETKLIKETVVTKEEKDKDNLMKEIISKKDVELFEQNRTKFNENELKYIEEKLQA